MYILPGAEYVGALAVFVCLCLFCLAGGLTGGAIFSGLYDWCITKTYSYKRMVSGAKNANKWWLEKMLWIRIGFILGYCFTGYCLSGPAIYFIERILS